MSARCDAGVHAWQWLRQPERQPADDTWRVVAKCSTCGAVERIDVTGTPAMRLWQYDQAWKKLGRAMLRARVAKAQQSPAPTPAPPGPSKRVLEFETCLREWEKAVAASGCEIIVESDEAIRSYAERLAASGLTPAQWFAKYAVPLADELHRAMVADGQA